VNLLKPTFERSPLLARALPFVVFLGLTCLQGPPGNPLTYWLYAAKTVVGAWLVWEMRPFVTEARWAFSLPAVAVGVGIAVIWVGINGEWTTQDHLWVKLGLTHAPKEPAKGWNPFAQFGAGSPLAWGIVVIRLLGSSLVVPPIEEAFYRSFLYRYIASAKFLEIPLNRFAPMPFLVTAAIFGFSHNEWLAGIVCGLAYQWLVLRRGHLGEAMTAHGITNFLLGVWVVWRGAWNFW
jgi:uncharacterized protein